MKVSTIGLIFALVFGLAVVTSAKTTRQILPTKPSQQLPQVLFSKEELLNASVFDPAFQKRTFNADDFSSFMSILTNTKATEAIVCILLLGSGILALRSMRRDSPLGPYVLQILGLTFILPVVVIVTTIMKVEAQAVMGLLGTIVGNLRYIARYCTT